MKVSEVEKQDANRAGEAAQNSATASAITKVVNATVADSMVLSSQKLGVGQFIVETYGGMADRFGMTPEHLCEVAISFWHLYHNDVDASWNNLAAVRRYVHVLEAQLDKAHRQIEGWEATNRFLVNLMANQRRVN